MFESLYWTFLCCLVLSTQQFYLRTNTFYVWAYTVVLVCLHYSVHALHNADGRGFGGRGRTPIHWRFVTSAWYLSSCWIYFVNFFHFISSSTMSPQKEKGCQQRQSKSDITDEWYDPLVLWISANIPVKFLFHLYPHFLSTLPLTGK